jgi:hypothetical protein
MLSRPFTTASWIVLPSADACLYSRYERFWDNDDDEGSDKMPPKLRKSTTLSSMLPLSQEAKRVDRLKPLSYPAVRKLEVLVRNHAFGFGLLLC